jgi:DNA-binding GntR family transcriptional regulator
LADTYGLTRGTLTTYRYRIGGEVVNGEKPTCLLKFYYLTAISGDQVARLNTDASLDIWPEISPVEVKCHDVLSSRLPTAEEANLLKITNNTPVIEVQSMTTPTTGDIPLLIQQSVFVGTSFAYNYNYTRP